MPSVIVESLENRVLLYGASLSDGVLRVRGDEGGRELIELRLNPERTQVIVSIEGDDLAPFAAADITRITVNGKSDDDTISINEANGRLVGFKVELHGGDGDDIIRGGKDKLKAFGGDGNDHLLSVRGYAEGGLGHDTIEGSRGKDYLFGGDGRDVIDGEQGNDVIWGGPGRDRLEGDEGNDIVFGEDGDDTITGGTGDDRLFGMLNIDRIEGEDGDDTLFGGRHEDVLLGGDGGEDEKTYREFEGIEELISKLLKQARKYV
jgi:Ca2+-binding RTX toxin-like protein